MAPEGKRQWSQMDPGPQCQAGSSWGWGPLCPQDQRAWAWPGYWNGSLIPSQWKRSPAPSGAKAKICWETGEGLIPSEGWVGQAGGAMGPRPYPASCWGSVGIENTVVGLLSWEYCKPRLAFNHQNPQVPNLGRGRKGFPVNNSNSNYCCCWQALGQEFCRHQPIGSSWPLSLQWEFRVPLCR